MNQIETELGKDTGMTEKEKQMSVEKGGRDHGGQGLKT